MSEASLQVHFTAAEAEAAEMAGASVVVVDVVRATTTMVEALANGARAIYPTHSTENAIKLASSLGREDVLLCGERKGLKVEGFDLGNSPGEYTRERVEGKRLVMSTTNGTRAFLATEDARRVVAGSFLNLDAVADAVAEAEAVTVICAGKEDFFSLDDAVCAGCVVERIVERRGEEGISLDDAARAALTLAGEFPVDPGFLRATAAGAALVGIGLESDLALCSRLNRYRLVPEMKDRMIRLPESR